MKRFGLPNYFSVVAVTLFVAGFLAFYCSKKDNKNPVNPKSDEATTGTMTDIDGNITKTVKIGNQWWMATTGIPAAKRHIEIINDLKNHYL